MFLAQAAGAGVALAGGATLLDAPQAHASWSEGHRPGRPRPGLSTAETALLAAWCDHLAPGARRGGVGDFVNAQLAKHPDDALLGIRYFGWPPPWDAFYRDGLNAIASASQAAFGRSFTTLDGPQRADLHQRLLTGATAWSASAPFFLFYLVTRSDAVDVVYGLPEGFARLGLPYEPRVKPRTSW